MKKAGKRFSKKFIALATLAILIIIVIIGAVINHKKINEIYYKHKVNSVLASENKKLDDPIKTLGFTDVKKTSDCKYFLKYGYTGEPLTCTEEQQSYKVFNDDASKNQTIAAAQAISQKLKQNGWQQGHYEVGKWYKDVLGGVDYNPDAYYSKQVGKVFCTFDSFVAYSKPKPPAVSVQFMCEGPEVHPPGRY